MSPKVKKYLFEILRFIEEVDSIISEFEHFEQFQSDAKAIRVLERLYEIIGEALRKALHEHPGLPISDARKIVALRNILAIIMIISLVKSFGRRPSMGFLP